jgi:hypothetical protein
MGAKPDFRNAIHDMEEKDRMDVSVSEWAAKRHCGLAKFN